MKALTSPEAIGCRNDREAAENCQLAVAAAVEQPAAADCSEREPSGQADTFSAVTITGTLEALSLEPAVDAFLTLADVSPTSVRVYRQALDQLTRELPADRTFEQLEADSLEHAATRAWGHLGPATWNRNLAIVRSFIRSQSLDTRAQLTPHVKRRREPADWTRAVPWPVLERLFPRRWFNGW